MIGSQKIPRSRYFISSITLLRSFSKLLLSKMEKGKKTELFEKRLSDYFGVRFCRTVSAYRIGLHFVLKALNLSKNEEVLLTPITIPDTVNVIRVLGLQPVFVDMSPDDHNVDLVDLERKVSPRSRVLLLTHLSGLVPDMEAILEKAHAHDLILLEDVSQSYGARHKGRLLGTFGLAGLGSLTAGKTISSLLGGFVVSDDEGVMNEVESAARQSLVRPKRWFFLYPLFDSLSTNLLTSPLFFSCCTYYLLRLIALIRPNFAATIHETKFVAKHTTWNVFFDDIPILRDNLPDEFFFWMSDWQSELALETFQRFEQGNAKRRRLAKALYDSLGDTAKRLLPSRIVQFHSNTYYHFPFTIEGDRSRFQKRLLEKGVDTGGYGLNLCSEEPLFRCYSRETPNAARIKKQGIFLPLHDDFTQEQVIHVARAVNECLS